MNPCIDCDVMITSPDVFKQAWEFSTATTLDEAKTVEDPPSYWAGQLLTAYHQRDHNWNAAVGVVAALRKLWEREKGKEEEMP